jgi:hypothetical protein
MIISGGKNICVMPIPSIVCILQVPYTWCVLTGYYSIHPARSAHRLPSTTLNLLFICPAFIINSHLLPRASILTLMDNLLPAQRLGVVFEIFNRREVVFVLLHRRDPGYIVKGHNFEAEVLVVADLLDFAEECGKVGCGDVVYVGEEVCWCELETVSNSGKL